MESFLKILGVKSYDPDHIESLGFLLSDNDKLILIECGPYTIKSLKNININCRDIDIVFISHWHWDHWGGLLSLLDAIVFEEYYNICSNNKPLKIYLPSLEGPEFQIIFKNYEYLIGNKIMLHESSFFGGVMTTHSIPTWTAEFKISNGKNIIYIPDNHGYSKIISDLAAKANFLIIAIGGSDERKREMDMYKFNTTMNILKILETYKYDKIIIFHIFHKEDIAEIIKSLGVDRCIWESGTTIAL